MNCIIYKSLFRSSNNSSDIEKDALARTLVRDIVCGRGRFWNIVMREGEMSRRRTMHETIMRYGEKRRVQLVSHVHRRRDTDFLSLRVIEENMISKISRHANGIFNFMNPVQRIALFVNYTGFSTYIAQTLFKSIKLQKQ